MHGKIDWKTSAASAAVHAMRRVGRPRRQAGELAERMAPAVECLRQTVRLPGDSADTLLCRLAYELAIRAEMPAAVRASLHAIIPDHSGNSLVVDGITQAVVLGVARLREENPRLDTELAMRQGPLRMQYEARGPGLLREMQRYVPQVHLSGGVTVVCLPPYRPGDVVCVPGAAAVLCEAPLTDLTPELPEVLRLVWGLCGVGTQDRANEEFANLTLPEQRVGLIAPLLWVAQSLELARYDLATVQRALEMWLPAANEGVPLQTPSAAQLMAAWDQRNRRT